QVGDVVVVEANTSVANRLTDEVLVWSAVQANLARATAKGVQHVRVGRDPERVWTVTGVGGAQEFREEVFTGGRGGVPGAHSCAKRVDLFAILKQGDGAILD